MYHVLKPTFSAVTFATISQHMLATSHCHVSAIIKVKVVLRAETIAKLNRNQEWFHDMNAFMKTKRVFIIIEKLTACFCFSQCWVFSQVDTVCCKSTYCTFTINMNMEQLPQPLADHYSGECFIL